MRSSCGDGSSVEDEHIRYVTNKAEPSKTTLVEFSVLWSVQHGVLDAYYHQHRCKAIPYQALQQAARVGHQQSSGNTARGSDHCAEESLQQLSVQQGPPASLLVLKSGQEIHQASDLLSGGRPGPVPCILLVLRASGCPLGAMTQRCLPLGRCCLMKPLRQHTTGTQPQISQHMTGLSADRRQSLAPPCRGWWVSSRGAALRGVSGIRRSRHCCRSSPTGTGTGCTRRPPRTAACPIQ